MSEVMHDFIRVGIFLLPFFTILEVPVQNSNSSNGQSLCILRPQHHQLDFWIGEWEVTAAGKKIGLSRIQRIIDGCAILENYSQPGGFQGKSINFYDSKLDRWRQTWVDSEGNVSEFAGAFKDGAMLLEGVSHTSSGQNLLRRMILKPQEQGRVRQYSERSLDGGKTWSVAYDFIYVQKAASP